MDDHVLWISWSIFKMQRLREEIKENIFVRQKKTFFHHDNAPASTFVITIAKIQEWKLELLCHSPYLLKLTLKDYYYLFQVLKNCLVVNYLLTIKRGSLRLMAIMRNSIGHKIISRKYSSKLLIIAEHFLHSEIFELNVRLNFEQYPEFNL